MLSAGRGSEQGRRADHDRAHRSHRQDRRHRQRPSFIFRKPIHTSVLAFLALSFISSDRIGFGLLPAVRAHEHHQDGPADETVPIDTILWMHMGLQLFVWLALFPLTMVLGLVRHRLHVPLSVLSLALTTGGYLLGHSHGGRSFPHTAHGTTATLLIFYLAAQGGLGLFLKTHLDFPFSRQRTANPTGGRAGIRSVALFTHGVLGKTFPLVGWVQCLFGITTLRGWCFGGHLGQCAAHYIMGSAFAAYCILLLIMLKAGAGWLARRGQSQEYFDSWVILLWGIVNTFTEHHGGPWTHKDLQHTLMGVLWWAGGAVGVWLSRGGRRTVWPGVIIIITGWGMSGHAQALMLSTMIHGLFGYALMAAGAARIIEVCFVVHDQPTGQIQDGNANQPRRDAHGWYPAKAFQYLPPYLLVASGILFMSATDEELHWADGQGVDHVTWGLIDFSISLLIFFWSNVLLDLYISWGGRYGMRSGKDGAGGGGAGEAPIDLEEYERLELRESTEGGPRTPQTPARAGNNNNNDNSPAQPLGIKTIMRNGAKTSGHANGNGHANGYANGHVNGFGEERQEQQHVLFDEDEDDEDVDPFDDARQK